MRQAHAKVRDTVLSRGERICFINAFKLDSPAAVYTTVYQAISGKSDAGLMA